MDIRLIKLFNAALVENNKMNDITFKDINILAARVGYFVHPDVCNESVIEFLKDVELNPNATFYKAWEDVVSKDRVELAIDQILHYLTTYGTDFALGNGYVPNDNNNNAPILDFKNYKVIWPITESELGKRCYDMLCSGIALKKDTMMACADFVIDRVKSGAMMIDVDAIKNREGQIYVCTKINIWPENPISLFRMIMFMTTNNTLIVNNNATIASIKNSKTPFNFNKLSDINLVKLSSIFLRFKNLFLAFKHNTTVDNKSVINKLRKLAVENHKPFKAGFWQTLFSEPKSIDDIYVHLDELTNYKKVALMQLCLEHFEQPKDNLYVIRNGKQFFKVNDDKVLSDNEIKDKKIYAMSVYNILKDSILEILKNNSQKDVIVTDIETKGVEHTVTTVKKPKVVKVPSGMHVMLPASEKTFIGNYPFGTSFDLTRNNLIGCYWRNEWGTHDYDLSLIDMNGNKIGWNANYYDTDKNVVYSGDMTEAKPEACEVMRISNPELLCAAVIRVNQFRGEAKSKFELFFGQSNNAFKYKAYENYMVDPNDIKFRATIEHENKKELQVAFVGNNKITLMEIHSGNKIVSHAHSTQSDYIKMLQNKTNWFVDAAEMLKEAGFQIVDETYTGEVDIDFGNLDKDSLISLMA